jgi:hypothetical protein
MALTFDGQSNKEENTTFSSLFDSGDGCSSVATSQGVTVAEIKA